MAVAIADQKELPGMNLQYFHRNLGWNYLARPKLLDLPSGDELDLLGQQLKVSMLLVLDFIDSLDFVDFVEISFGLSYTQYFLFISDDIFGLSQIYNSSLVWFILYNLDPPGFFFSFYFCSIY